MLNLYYEYFDHGKKKTLIVLHGFLNDHRSMFHVASAQKNKANIIYVDLPGFGQTKSTNVQYSMADIAESLNHILKDYRHTDLYMLGYSMGGRVALAFACIYPDLLKGLILESTSPGVKVPEARKERAAIDSKRAEKIVKDYYRFIQSWENMGLFSSQENLEYTALVEQREQRLAQNPKEVADSLNKYGTGIQPSYWGQLNDIETKTLQLVGRKDEKFVFINEKMNQLIPGAELKIIEHSGHNIHLEARQKFDIIVSAFINEEDINV